MPHKLPRLLRIEALPEAERPIAKKLFTSVN
jgi:hypothetical protein